MRSLNLAFFAAVALLIGVAVCKNPLTVETLHQFRRVGAQAVNARGDVVWSERTWTKVLFHQFDRLLIVL
jgi:hypothetical protein